MPKDEWGVKRVCPACSTRFYDLRNDPMTCPNCGAVHTADSLAAGKTRSMVADKADPKTAAAEAAASAEEETDEVVLDDEDDAEEEDADLGDDVLDDDSDEDNVSLDDLADVAKEDDEES